MSLLLCHECLWTQIPDQFSGISWALDYSKFFSFWIWVLAFCYLSLGPVKVYSLIHECRFIYVKKFLAPETKSSCSHISVLFYSKSFPYWMSSTTIVYWVFFYTIRIVITSIFSTHGLASINRNMWACFYASNICTSRNLISSFISLLSIWILLLICLEPAKFYLVHTWV